jgi:hypothetical protein
MVALDMILFVREESGVLEQEEVKNSRQYMDTANEVKLIRLEW